jgi:hypothetical protein
MLAMDVNVNAGFLEKLSALTFFASMLAPTEEDSRSQATGAGGGSSGRVGSPGSVGCSLGVSGSGWPGMPPAMLTGGCANKDQAKTPT